MKKGIVIVTWSGGKPQLDLLLLSLGEYRKYPFYIVYNDVSNGPANQVIDLHRDYNILVSHDDTFECGALQAVLDHTDLDEFILLQDTIEILRPQILDKLLDNYPGKSVSVGPSFQFFLGKFRREALQKLEIPDTRNKHDSINLGEALFLQKYREIEETVVFDPNFGGYHVNPLTSRPIEEFETRWGRVNLVTRNKYLVKRQGTWSDI